MAKIALPWRDGEWVSSDRRNDSTNPVTSKVIATYAHLTEGEGTRLGNRHGVEGFHPGVTLLPVNAVLEAS